MQFHEPFQCPGVNDESVGPPIYGWANSYVARQAARPESGVRMLSEAEKREALLAKRQQRHVGIVRRVCVGARLRAVSFVCVRVCVGVCVGGLVGALV